MLLQGRRDDTRNVALARDICLNRDDGSRVTAGLGQLPAGFVQRRRLASADRETGPCLEILAGDLESKTLARSGDDCHLALQSGCNVHTAPPRVPTAT